MFIATVDATDLDSLLASHHVVDCTGKVTHTLTLLIDGTVRVAFTGGRELVANPRDRTCLTPGATIPEGLWPEIASLTAPGA